MCPCGMYTVHAGVYIMYMQVDTACIGNVGVEFVRIAYISINQSISLFPQYQNHNQYQIKGNVSWK